MEKGGSLELPLVEADGTGVPSLHAAMLTFLLFGGGPKGFLLGSKGEGEGKSARLGDGSHGDTAVLAGVAGDEADKLVDGVDQPGDEVAKEPRAE